MEQTTNMEYIKQKLPNTKNATRVQNSGRRHVIYAYTSISPINTRTWHQLTFHDFLHMATTKNNKLKSIIFILISSVVILIALYKSRIYG